MSILDSFISKYMFQEGGEDGTTTAIYPMNEFLKSKNEERAILGGSALIEDNEGIARFNNLGIPAGLYLEKENVLKNKPHAKGDCNVINDDLFEKLFNSVAQIKSSGSKTKKNYSKRTSTHKKAK